MHSVRNYSNLPGPTPTQLLALVTASDWPLIILMLFDYFDVSFIYLV